MVQWEVQWPDTNNLRGSDGLVQAMHSIAEHRAAPLGA